MYYLIDFENCKDAGLDGSWMLKPSDHLILFYSRYVPNIYLDIFRQICATHCDFRIIKLVRKGDSALDFYIATHVGEIFASDSNAEVAIISRDNDFISVADYWLHHQMRKEITLAHSIREAITGQRNTGDKFAGIGNIRADIQNQYAHDRMSIIIGHKLACMNIPDSDVAAADEIMHTYPAPRQMYLECLKKFGRTIGLSIYHLIQDEIKTQFISNVINLRISICSEKNN